MPRPALRFFDRPTLLLVLTVLFWAGNFVLGRAVRAEVPPVALAFWRWGVATALVAPFAWRPLLRDLPELRRHWRTVLVLALLGVGVFNTLIYLALQSTTALSALLMQSAMPVLIVGLSFAIFRERITTLQALGVALSLAGAAAIVTGGQPRLILTLGTERGTLLVFVAVLCYAAYSVLLKRRPELHPLSFLVATFAIGALLLLPFYLWETLAGRPLRPTPAALGSIAYVGVFPSILSYLFYNRGVELIGANRAGLYIHLLPLFGSLLAVLLLGEAFRAYHAAGMALIVGGIVLATKVGVRRRA